MYAKSTALNEIKSYCKKNLHCNDCSSLTASLDKYKYTFYPKQQKKNEINMKDNNKNKIN